MLHEKEAGAADRMDTIEMRFPVGQLFGFLALFGVVLAVLGLSQSLLCACVCMQGGCTVCAWAAVKDTARQNTRYKRIQMTRNDSRQIQVPQ